MNTVTVTVTETEILDGRKLRPGDTVDVPADHRLALIYGAGAAARPAERKAGRNAG